MGYNSKYTGAQVEAILDSVEGKANAVEIDELNNKIITITSELQESVLQKVNQSEYDTKIGEIEQDVDGLKTQQKQLDSRITDNAETLSILTGSSNGSIEKQINDAVSAEAEIARAAELANQEAIAQIDNRTNIIETDYLKTSDKQELNNALESLDERVTNNVNSLLSFLNDKQDKINDIDAIRNNAEQALKQVPDEYITEDELTQKQYVTKSSLFDALSDKQDTISDLESIREGAALGATSAQQQDIVDLETTLGFMETKTNAANTYATITSLNNVVNSIDTINEQLSFIEGVSTVASVTNVPISKRLVIASISTNQSLTLIGIPKAGREIHMLVHNTSPTQITLSIPNSGNYVNTQNSNAMTINSGSYGEINLISDGGKVYIKYS